MKLWEKRVLFACRIFEELATSMGLGLAVGATIGMASTGKPIVLSLVLAVSGVVYFFIGLIKPFKRRFGEYPWR